MPLTLINTLRLCKQLPPLAGMLLLPALSVPAAAQFGSIFGGPPPRPPANVPFEQDSRTQVDPRIPDRVFPQYEPPPPPFSRLPPPPGGLPPGPPPGVQTQPLPPPPGAPSQDANAPASGPGPAPLGGLPPGQRQPKGSPQPGGAQPGVPPQTDEVVVAPPAQKVVNPTAMFSGLDKITGRIISFDVAINETVQFGALRMTPRACYTRPPTETPNTDGFVEIDEITLQGEVKRIFTGWMFTASPGLHGVEHPIYDVWLTDCKKEAPSVAETKPQQAAQQAPAAAPASAAPVPAPSQLRR
jgi:hypothetical protein